MALCVNSLDNIERSIVHMMLVLPVVLGVWSTDTSFHLLFDLSFQLDCFVVNSNHQTLGSVKLLCIDELEMLFDKDSL